MKIKGIGTISKRKAMEILTREGRDAVESGEITLEELGEMYKLEQVKKACRIGNNTETFRACPSSTIGAFQVTIFLRLL